MVFFSFKCYFIFYSSSSSRIIAAKDHASIQLDIVRVDPATGRMIDGEVTRYAICGKLRFMVNFKKLLGV
jgi:hypothetical protein